MTALPYSRLDRLTHRIAFAHRAIQDVLAEVEATAFGAAWRDQPIERPIFVTALPRAGTTLILELLARTVGAATPCYRDMPFVRAPILWSRLSRRFRAAGAGRERAHGDGMIVDADSPEAFEEILWLARCPDQFGPDGIALMHRLAPAFAADLADFMRRIIVLRHGGVSSTARYLAKNNANIARIAALRAAFPDALIVVPLRDPLAQARSMLRQHRRFSDLHASQGFARRYMADIGHFEFGATHRPILFDGVAELARRLDTDRLDYWVGYWLAAHRHLAAQEGVLFIDHAGLCRDGARNFEHLCDVVGLAADAGAVSHAAGMIRPQPDTAPDAPAVEGLDDARDLFERLRARSLFAPGA